MHAAKVREAALTHDLTSAALLLTLGKVLEDDATFKIGPNLLNFLIDMTEFLRINVDRLTAGNSMTFRVHTNASMLIIRYNSAEND